MMKTHNILYVPILLSYAKADFWASESTKEWLEQQILNNEKTGGKFFQVAQALQTAANATTDLNKNNQSGKTRNNLICDVYVTLLVFPYGPTDSQNGNSQKEDANSKV